MESPLLTLFGGTSLAFFLGLVTFLWLLLYILLWFAVALLA